MFTNNDLHINHSNYNRNTYGVYSILYTCNPHLLMPLFCVQYYYCNFCRRLLSKNAAGIRWLLNHFFDFSLLSSTYFFHCRYPIISVPKTIITSNHSYWYSPSLIDLHFIQICQMKQFTRKYNIVIIFMELHI